MDLPHLISIVGAGPGDPELLTIKAQNRLKSADIILYDALLEKEILNFGSISSEKIYVGKKCNDGKDQFERQNEIHTLFLKFARQNKKVVRLKGGDPMIFGRGAEEIRFCRDNHLNYEVIPGITAGLAASSLFEIPLTERGKNHLFLIYTGHLAGGKFTNLESVVEVLKSGSPVVIYMGLTNLRLLANALLEAGIDGKFPVQILCNISQEEQKKYTISLQEIGILLQKEAPETPAIVIIGKYAYQI